MESLLRWGIENTPLNADGSPAPPQNRQPLDTGIIDAILGKPDSELMKEAMAVAVDEKQSMDERLTALDNLEMVSPYYFYLKSVRLPSLPLTVGRVY